MHRRPLPLTITPIQTSTGGQVIVAATFSAGNDQPPRLLLQGGLWRLEIGPAEAERLLAFLQGWWGPGG